ncbi:MAG: CorA family divalent cation transporter, partial [Gemmatimonadota bacterium]
MKKRCFALSDSHGLMEIPADSVSEGTAEGCIWIDIEDYADDELSAWLRSVGFSPASIRASTQVRGRTRVSQFDDDVFFELPALAADIGSERVPLAFLCRPGLCVTIHQKHVEGLARTANRLTRDGGLSGPGVTVLLGALLAGLSTRAVDAADEIRRQVLEMQNAMDLDPSELDAGEIHDLSSAVRTLDSVISERVVVLDRLRLLQSPTLDLAENSDLKAADTEANYLDRVIDR